VREQTKRGVTMWLPMMRKSTSECQRVGYCFLSTVVQMEPGLVGQVGPQRIGLKLAK
jgi:hypothetical protein